MNDQHNTQESALDSMDLEALRKTLGVWYRKQAAWRELRLLALERLRETVKAPRGVSCPELLATGGLLAQAEPGAIQAPFDAFKDALLKRARDPASDAESKAIKQLAERSCDLYVAMAEAAQKELEASQAAALVRAQVQGAAVH